MKIALGIVIAAVIAVSAFLLVIATVCEASARKRPCPHRSGNCCGFRCREYSRCPFV